MPSEPESLIMLPVEDGEVRGFTHEEFEIISSRLMPGVPYEGKRSTDLSDPESRVAINGIEEFLNPTDAR